MKASHVIAAVRCNYCSRDLPPSGVHQISGDAQKICADCLRWHMHALEVFAGNNPPGCQSCGVTWAVLRDAHPGDKDVRMWVVPKDGIYQLLCRKCIAPYIGRRRDLYRGTAFGHAALHC